MTALPAVPLDTTDRTRAGVLKRKAADRLKDVRRHLEALRAAMAFFGDDFDLAAFETAFDSADPDELNRVKAVERGVDQLYNYMAELTAFGLELAQVRGRREEINARKDLERLAETGAISNELATRLQRLRELRRLLVHEYATATAKQVHQAAEMIDRDLEAFYRAYVEWVRRGFEVRS